jgi:hypothetical protein
MNLVPIFAQETQEVVRRSFEWGRIQSNADWILPIGVLTAILIYIAAMYRRDAAELHPAMGWLLTVLRTGVFVGLLIFYLQPQWRIESEKTVNSRAVVAIDTSLSMGLTDSDTSVSTGTTSRIEQVASALTQSDFIHRLRQTHDVLIARFDGELHRDFIDLPKLPAPGAAAATEPPPPDDAPDAAKPASEKEIDWNAQLALAGEETRMGQSVQQIIGELANQPLSGVIIIGDGGQNAGRGPEAIIEAARNANAIPVFTIGVGSDQQPSSVRVAAFNPPPRAYPGDPYTASGVVQAWRMAGHVVTVQLLSRPSSSAVTNPADRGTGEVIDTQTITLGGDGEEVPVKFQVTPDEVGRRTLALKVIPPETDRDKDDNLLEADIEIVDRKNRVLLFAGGPTREYQFLRNQLYRDKSITSDVLLQTARPGISQEAETILDEFPSTREELYQYDCIVAFDPDWQALDAEQVDLLESWVAEQGGGLLVVAGPVHTGNRIRGWVEDPSMAKIRALYPVEFPRRLSSIDAGAYKSEEVFPLEFTRDGLVADFLALSDSEVESRQAWEAFPGIYGYFPVRGAKQGATTLAYFGGKSADGEKPVYMAWQFYGSGRVFYMGSGEMWRLRAADPVYFEQLYTKLLRHVSKGRLLRGSTRGVLLVGQERYRLGNTVSVQAYRLTDSQLKDLVLPNVTLQIVQPDQSVHTIALAADSARPGSYSGQFTVLQEGDYRLELPLPGGDEERLMQKIRVEIPNLEREHPQRNDAVMSEIAQKTGGKYYVGLGAVLDGASDLVGGLHDKTRTLIYTATPSREWQEQWLLWLLIALFGFLCVEWTIRRLAKLA